MTHLGLRQVHRECPCGFPGRRGQRAPQRPTGIRPRTANTPGRNAPALLAGFEEDAVAWADDLDGSTAALAQADALGDEDSLAKRVAVPVSAGAGHEVDEVRRDP